MLELEHISHFKQLHAQYFFIREEQSTEIISINRKAHYVWSHCIQIRLYSKLRNKKYTWPHYTQTGAP